VDEPWHIAYFIRHPDDDRAQAAPGHDFLESCPIPVRRVLKEILASVASAPPPPVQTARAEPEQARPRVELPAEPALPAAGAPHRIAVLVPTTGANAGVGQSIANAANLALLDTGGGRIRITVYDTARGPAAAAAQALADGNRLFLGPLLAEDVRVVAPAARRAGVPVVAFSNDTGVAAGGVYLMGFNPAQSVARVVEHARSEGASRFAALVPEGIYGRRASEAMIQAARRGGATLVGTVPIGRGSVGLKGSATRLASFGGYDAVLIAESNLHHVPEHADRVYVMERGEIVFSGGLDALRSDSAAMAIVAAAA